MKMVPMIRVFTIFCLSVFILLVGNIADVHAQQRPSLGIRGGIGGTYTVGDTVSVTFVVSDANGLPVSGAQLNITHSGLTNVSHTNNSVATTDIGGSVTVTGTITDRQGVWILAEWSAEQMTARADFQVQEFQVQELDVTYAYSLYSGSTAVDFSPDGKNIATGDTDGDVGFWEVGNDDNIEYVRLGGNVQSVAFSSDSMYLAADGDDGDVLVALLDVATRTTVRSRYVHSDADNINAIAYSPDGRYVAIAADLPWAILWDLNNDALKGWGYNVPEVYTAAFSPDGRYLATGDSDGLWIWEVDTWWGNAEDVNVQHVDLGGNVRAIAFSPDGKYLAADGYDGTNTYVDIYRMSDMSIAWRVTTNDVSAIAFSPDSEYIAMGDTDGTIIFYQIGTNIIDVAETDAKDVVLDLAWSPDGTLISDGKDVWNVILPSEPGANATEPTHLTEDVNQDGIVDIVDLALVASKFGQTGDIATDVNDDGVVDILDLALVAAAFGDTAAAPIALGHDSEIVLTSANIKTWLQQAQQLNLTDPVFQRGIAVLEQLLTVLTPEKTVLLSNYPNPFNPETWIPYQLAEPSEITISIYTAKGQLIRKLDLGHKKAGVYQRKNRAAYWDGKNEFGERVASGLYFYTLTAGSFSATGKMLIRK